MSDKLKQMSIKHKLGYLWDYYKWVPVLVILVGGMLFFWGKRIIANNIRDSYCLILNDWENDKLAERVTSGFEAYMGDSDFNLFVDNGFMFSYVEEHGINWPDDSATIKLASLMASGQGDVAIADYETLLWVGYNNFARPLDEVLPEEMLSELEPYFMYYDEDEEDDIDEVLCALDISNTKVYRECAKEHSRAFVYIPEWTEQPEIAVDFIKYLYDLE